MMLEHIPLFFIQQSLLIARLYLFFMIIQINGLTKDYTGVRALNDVNLTVNEGELFGLLGPNGSGKSTMIKVLTGQIKPTSGGATVFGIDVLKEPVKVRELVGVIPEQENPPSFLTAEEYLYFIGQIRKIPDIKEKIDYWFSFFSFADQAKILCKDLSRGTRQKLMFAQAFLHNPKLAFIDEPLVNLDPIAQKKVKDYLKEQVKRGTSMFFSTHSLEIAEEICTQIAILDKGHILYTGSIKDLKKKKESLEHFFLKLVQNA
jgi:ABC-2 type transport system ATP-binding protein